MKQSYSNSSHASTTPVALILPKGTFKSSKFFLTINAPFIEEAFIKDGQCAKQTPVQAWKMQQ